MLIPFRALFQSDTRNKTLNSQSAKIVCEILLNKMFTESQLKLN